MISRGIISGVVGATALALYFLIVDGFSGALLRTPTFLANAILGAEGIEMVFAPLAVYTIVHYCVFIAVGILVSWVTSYVELSLPVLFGLVLGLALFDLVFYGSVVITGVNVVEAIGWPEVLFGNLIAGVGLVSTLYRLGETRSLSWWRALTRYPVVREGLVAGLIGAGVLAAWLLLVDVVQGRPFFSPAALGSTLFLGATNVDQVITSAFTVASYSVLHFGALIIAGFVAAAIAAAAEQKPPMALAALHFFVVFEASFMGGLAVAADFLIGALTWWSILIGNVLAAVGMVTYLWAKHPTLRLVGDRP